MKVLELVLNLVEIAFYTTVILYLVKRWNQ